MADRQMFVDAIAQGIALKCPEVPDPDWAAEEIVELIGVWEPAPTTGNPPPASEDPPATVSP